MSHNFHPISSVICWAALFEASSHAECLFPVKDLAGLLHQHLFSLCASGDYDKLWFLPPPFFAIPVLFIKCVACPPIHLYPSSRWPLLPTPSTLIPTLHPYPLVSVFKAAGRSLQHLCSSWNIDFIACGTLTAALYIAKRKKNTHIPLYVLLCTWSQSHALTPCSHDFTFEQTHLLSSICLFAIKFVLLQWFFVMSWSVMDGLFKLRKYLSRLLLTSLYVFLHHHYWLWL